MGIWPPQKTPDSPPPNGAPRRPLGSRGDSLLPRSLRYNLVCIGRCTPAVHWDHDNIRTRGILPLILINNDLTYVCKPMLAHELWPQSFNTNLNPFRL